MMIPSRKKVNCGLLRSTQHREANMDTVKIKFQKLSGSDLEDLNHKWSQISDALLSVSLDLLETSRKRHKDWFNESDHEVRELPCIKIAAHCSAILHPNSVYLRRKFAEVRAETQRNLRKIENNWWLG